MKAAPRARSPQSRLYGVVYGVRVQPSRLSVASTVRPLSASTFCSAPQYARSSDSSAVRPPPPKVRLVAAFMGL